MVQEAREAIATQRDGWQDEVEALCQYHLFMRDHAMKCEMTIHRMTKGNDHE